MIRLGLCCIFRDEPIKFRTTTARALSALPRPDALAKLALLCETNARSLRAALEFCAANGIGCFRITSQVLPLRTHPEYGYDVGELPGGDAIVRLFRACGEFARANDVRTGF